MTSPGNMDLEAALDSGPDLVAESLEKWRTASLDRERVEAVLYTTLKGTHPDMSATEIKAWINQNIERYEAVLKEVTAESEYTRLYERHLANKRRASLRVAF